LPTLAGLLGHGRRDVGGGNVPGRTDGGESRFRGEPSARGYVKDTHARCNIGGAQQKRHEVRRDMRESPIVLCCSLILEAEFLRHPRLLLLVLGLASTFFTHQMARGKVCEPPCTEV
jgi:hypothetical protein